VAEPRESGERVVTLDEVYAFYREYLGRDPDFATEALPRVGNSYLGTMAQVRCSQEAANYRANHGAEPDGWCFNRNAVTGAVIPLAPVPPPSQKIPPPPAQIPGGDIPVVGGVITALWPPIQSILQKVNAISTAVGDDIGRNLKPILEEVVAAGGRITQTLAENLSQLLPAALNLAAEAAERAGDVAQAFAEQAATVGDLMDGVAEKFGVHRDDIWKFATDALGAGFGGGIAAWLFDVETQHSDNLNPILDTIQRAETIPDWVKSAVGLRAGVTSPLAMIVGVSLLTSVAGAFAQALLNPELLLTQQWRNSQAPNAILGVSEAAVAVAKEVRDYPSMEGLAARNGFNADQFRLLADLAFQWPAPQETIAARQRGYIDPSVEDRLLNRLGYNAEARDVLKAMAIQLAPITDEIRFLVRDVYSPAIVENFRLMDNYPEGFDAIAARLGMPPETARKYWAAHWEYPSMSQAFEMMWRTSFSESDLDTLMQANDVLPRFREYFKQIAFNPLTRVDVRRIHDLRNKDHAWLLQQYRNIGYAPDNAEELAVFTELLNDDERKEKHKVLTGPLVSRIISATVSGTLNDEQAGAFFQRLKYDDEQIEIFLTEARLIRSETRAVRLWELLGDLYVKGRRTRLEVTTQLRERGATDGEIEERLREWDLEKELRAPTEREETERDLTRADIESGYRARKLTRDIARDMLLKLRYDPQETEFILIMADYKEAQAEEKDKVEVVHKKFVKGTMDRVLAGQTLDASGLRATQRDALLARWELEISAKTADLSVGQVGETYKLGHWDDEFTRSYLARIGYDEVEVSALLRSWGSKIEEAKRRTEQARLRDEETKKREAERIVAAAKRKEKDLAKTDLLAAGTAGTVDWTDVKIALVGIGYSPAEADILIRTKQQQGVKRNA
jgi:hypothetical protein